MRMRTLIVTIGALFGLSTWTCAQESVTPAGDLTAAAATSQPESEAAGASHDDPAQIDKAKDNRWRYKLHNGHWWFWMPDDYWVYWDNGRWIVYDRATYRTWLAAQRYPSSGGSRVDGSYSYRSGGSRWNFGGDFDPDDALDVIDDVGSAFGSAFGFPW